MKRFILKLFILSIPILLLAALYLVFDPFKTLYHYNSYYESGTTPEVDLNIDLVGIQTFINNYPKYHYNSFIIGNSRTIYYNINSWEKYINSNSCYHLNSYGESIYGIHQKMKFLEKNKVQINNALIVLDYGTLSRVSNINKHLNISHYLLSDQNWLEYQMVFFKSFLTSDFLIDYFGLKIRKLANKYSIQKSDLKENPVNYNSKYNEIRYTNIEDILKNNPKEYYNSKRMKVFYLRDTTIQKYSPKIISESQLKMLKDIKNILTKNNTNYKIVINPLYDQKKLNRGDILILNEVFGKDNVFDFSGINSITNDYHNYYETSHYRPHVADIIMNKIYNKEIQ